MTPLHVICGLPPAPPPIKNLSYAYDHALLSSILWDLLHSCSALLCDLFYIVLVLNIDLISPILISDSMILVAVSRLQSRNFASL